MVRFGLRFRDEHIIQNKRTCKLICNAYERRLISSLHPVMRASPLEPQANAKVLPLVGIRKPEDVKQFVTGSDSDIGGHSKAVLDTYPEDSPDAGKGRFHGVLSSKLAPGMKLAGSKVDRSGYAGFRTKVGSFLLFQAGPSACSITETYCLSFKSPVRRSLAAGHGTHQVTCF